MSSLQSPAQIRKRTFTIGLLQFFDLKAHDLNGNKYVSIKNRISFAGDLWQQTCITAGEDSLAGLSPTGGKSGPVGALRLVFVFVGASLLANRAGKRASPQANIRWQACLLQGTSQAPSGHCGLSLSL
jgi:hypothetical protein